LLVYGRIGVVQYSGGREKVFTDHGKEFRRCLPGIAVKGRGAALFKALPEFFECLCEYTGPLGEAHVRVERWVAVGHSIQRIEFMRHLMEDHVVALTCGEDIGPRKNYRTMKPRLTRAGFVIDVYHTRFVTPLPVRDKFAWIEDYGVPTVVPIKAEIEHGQAGERCDRNAHGVVEEQFTRGLNALLMQK
jgi:hypothetical protein